MKKLKYVQLDQIQFWSKFYCTFYKSSYNKKIFVSKNCKKLASQFKNYENEKIGYQIDIECDHPFLDKKIPVYTVVFS